MKMLILLLNIADVSFCEIDSLEGLNFEANGGLSVLDDTFHIIYYKKSDRPNAYRRHLVELLHEAATIPFVLFSDDAELCNYA